MMEKWKTIVSYNNYQVSNLGRVKSIRCILNPTVDYRGYRVIQLPGKRTTKVAKLVLEAFKELRPLNMEVDHRNRIRGDDRLVNLRWSTRLENVVNRGRFVNSSSGGVPGVSWYKKNSKWRAFKKTGGNQCFTLVTLIQ